MCREGGKEENNFFFTFFVYFLLLVHVVQAESRTEQPNPGAPWRQALAIWFVLLPSRFLRSLEIFNRAQAGRIVVVWGKSAIYFCVWCAEFSTSLNSFSVQLGNWSRHFVPGGGAKNWWLIWGPDNNTKLARLDSLHQLKKCCPWSQFGEPPRFVLAPRREPNHHKSFAFCFLRYLKQPQAPQGPSLY